MEIKILQPTYAYYRSIQTTLKDLDKHVGKVPLQLMDEATKKGFEISGPQFWNYTGITGNPDIPFQLDICIPVENKSGISSANAGNIEGFRSASLIVKGSWSNLKEAYERLMSTMVSEKLTPGNTCREIYHQVNFENPAKCTTEIFVEINEN
jgi:effector-binding domain-containing protein